MPLTQREVFAHAVAAALKEQISWRDPPEAAKRSSKSARLRRTPPGEFGRCQVCGVVLRCCILLLFAGFLGKCTWGVFLEYCRVQDTTAGCSSCRKAPPLSTIFYGHLLWSMFAVADPRGKHLELQLTHSIFTPIAQFFKVDHHPGAQPPPSTSLGLRSPRWVGTETLCGGLPPFCANVRTKAGWRALPSWTLILKGYQNQRELRRGNASRVRVRP